MSECQRRESSGSTNRRIAEKLMCLRKAQVLEDRWNLPKSHSPRLAVFATQFLQSISHENTRDRYSSSVKHFLRYLGAVKLSDVTPERIVEFQQSRLASGIRAATINRDTNTLSALMSKARKLRLISRNPCADVDKLEERRERRQAKPFTYDEETRLKQLSSSWLSTLITLLAETGLRVNKEALPLRWSDVLLDSNPPFIYVRDSKSAAGIRTVWLTRHCREALMRWRTLLDPQFSEFVFPSPKNVKLHRVDYKNAWRDIARKAGLADRRIYDLRATFASRANACRASGLTVAQLLGHSSIHILPAYVKPIDENTRAVIEALDVARVTYRTRPNSIQ